MGRLVYGLQQSLDGYVDHQLLGRPGPVVMRHFLERVRHAAGLIYGSRTYGIMQYWDAPQDDWDEATREFGEAWRSRRKYVVSDRLGSVGPNATLISGNIETAIGALKAAYEGELDVAGPTLAASLAELGLIDEYRLYLRPVVLGGGTKFFAPPRRAMRLVGCEDIGEGMVRLRYVPG